MPALLSILFDHDEGKLISKAPKKEMPKIIKSIKRKILNIQLVDKLFNAFFGSTVATKAPTSV